MSDQSVLVSGATGYMGSRLAAALLGRGYRVHALVRRGSEGKLPAGCVAVLGDALDATTFAHAVPRSAAFVHLVGVAHPSPAKAAEFRTIDLASVKASIAAAVAARSDHFVYVSVARPAPMMKAYQEARAEGEAALAASGLNATVLRPWYVLGPGHRWPYVLVPFYALAEVLPATRDGARRLGLVTLPQMVAALVHAVERPATGTRVVAVPEIRSASF